MSFGLGFGVVREPKGVRTTLSAGTFRLGGVYGTQAWADPVRRQIDILMIRRAKLPNAGGSAVRQAFRVAASQRPEPPSAAKPRTK